MKNLIFSLIFLLSFAGIVQADYVGCVEQGGTIDLYVQHKDSVGVPSTGSSRVATIVDSTQATVATITDGSFTNVASKTGWDVVTYSPGGGAQVGLYSVQFSATVDGISGLVDIDNFDVRTSGGKCGITTAEVNTEVDTGLTDYAGATSSELSTHDGKLDTVDTNVDAILVDTTGLNGDAMRGTDNAATASALSTHDGKLDTAQADLDTITGADGTTLATTQGNYAPAKAGDAMTLTAAAVDLIFAEGVEGIYSMRDVLCIISGVIAAKLSTTGSTASFRGLEDTEDRSTVTFAAGGNRSAVTFDLTGCQ